MKKAKFCTLAVLLILLSLVTGCQQETARYVVSFVDEGTSVKEVIVNDGEVIKQSDIPELNEKEGLSFQGWYLGDKKFEFTTTIRSNIVLEARWIHDKHVFGEDGVCTICNGTKCGADAVASFDEESKVLTITGRGSLDNYELDPENGKDDYKYIIDPPWYSRINEIKSIVIGEGITSVGDFSFCDIAVANEGNLTVLESVTLPSTLESIGVFAFFATGISEISFPEGVLLNIDSFSNCKNLNTVRFPNKFSFAKGSGGDYIFENSKNIRKIYYAGTKAEWDALGLDKSDFGKPKDNPKVYTTDCPEGFELGNVYIVNIDLNGGEGKESIQVKEGSPIPEDAYPTKDGYEFVCWALDNGSIFTIETPVKGQLNLKAIWGNEGVEVNNYKLVNITKGTAHTDLTKTIDGSDENDTILLLDDYATENKTYSFKYGTILDLNHKTLTNNGNSYGQYYSGENILIKNGTINGCTVNFSSSYSAEPSLRLKNVLFKCTLSVEDGYVLLEEGNNIIFDGVSNSGPIAVEYGSGKLVINDGEYTHNNAEGKSSVYFKGKELIIKYGTFNKDIVIEKVDDVNSSDVVTVEILNGTFNGNLVIKEDNHSWQKNITISGGLFTGKIQNEDSKNSTIIITGGTFSFDPTNYVDADTYNVIKNEDTWSVTQK